MTMVNKSKKKKTAAAAPPPKKKVLQLMKEWKEVEQQAGHITGYFAAAPIGWPPKEAAKAALEKAAAAEDLDDVIPLLEECSAGLPAASKPQTHIN